MTGDAAVSIRIYAVGIAVVLFLVMWAVVAGRPWAGPTAVAPRDPRMAALDRLEDRLHDRAEFVQATVARRWTRYRARLAERLRHGAVAAPATVVRGPARTAAPPVVWLGAREPLVLAKTS